VTLKPLSHMVLQVPRIVRAVSSLSPLHWCPMRWPRSVEDMRNSTRSTRVALAGRCSGGRPVEAGYSGRDVTLRGTSGSTWPP
jgi:hypothetical protein